MEQSKKWKQWEKKYTKKVNKLAQELTKLLRRAPDGTLTPVSLNNLKDELDGWG